MDDPLNKEENSKNIYVIRHKLSELKKITGRSYYEWRIGPFVVRIFNRADEHNIPYITQCEMVDVEIREASRRDDQEVLDNVISLKEDSRFKNYKPIQYNTWKNPDDGHIINFSDGDNIPISYLCELIRYLHRLANLTAFM
jgi:hypothetical protein